MIKHSRNTGDSACNDLILKIKKAYSKRGKYRAQYEKYMILTLIPKLHILFPFLDLIKSKKIFKSCGTYIFKRVVIRAVEKFL